MSRKEVEKCQNETNQLVEKGLICLSQSSFHFHAMYVPKKDDGNELPEKTPKCELQTLECLPT